jgi:hypothetical protein
MYMELCKLKQELCWNSGCHPCYKITLPLNYIPALVFTF